MTPEKLIIGIIFISLGLIFFLTTKTSPTEHLIFIENYTQKTT
jgi:hypothetical protein